MQKNENRLPQFVLTFHPGRPILAVPQSVPGEAESGLQPEQTQKHSWIDELTGGRRADDSDPFILPTFTQHHVPGRQLTIITGNIST